MKKIPVILLFILCLAAPSTLFADECMEGDCDNGVGSGFTDNNLIYEGEWKDGLPDSKGKLVKEENVNEEKETPKEE